jgi:23S rRNA pseudoU1915 N3-methylase RlmH
VLQQQGAGGEQAAQQSMQMAQQHIGDEMQQMQQAIMVAQQQSARSSVRADASCAASEAISDIIKKHTELLQSFVTMIVGPSHGVRDLLVNYNHNINLLDCPHNIPLSSYLSVLSVTGPPTFQLDPSWYFRTGLYTLRS